MRLLVSWVSRRLRPVLQFYSRVEIEGRLACFSNLTCECTSVLPYVRTNAADARELFRKIYSRVCSFACCVLLAATPARGHQYVLLAHMERSPF